MSELEPSTVNTPRIVHQGRYRLYEKSDGTLRIQYRRDDKETDDFFEIPGLALRMAQSLAEGKLNPLEAMGTLRKLRNNA